MKELALQRFRRGPVSKTFRIDDVELTTSHRDEAFPSQFVDGATDGLDRDPDVVRHLMEAQLGDAIRHDAVLKQQGRKPLTRPGDHHVDHSTLSPRQRPSQRCEQFHRNQGSCLQRSSQRNQVHSAHDRGPESLRGVGCGILLKTLQANDFPRTSIGEYLLSAGSRRLVESKQTCRDDIGLG